MKYLALSALVLFSLDSQAAPAMQSVYTSVAVQDCVTIESSDNEPEPEIDYYTGHCAGKAGYTVKISGGDIRYSLSLLYGNQEAVFTRIGAFHDMGSSKIEWRGFSDGRGGVSKYHSLIYRLNINDYDPEGNPVGRDRLFVVRLAGAKSCLIGQVPQSAGMNEAARRIADDMTRPCQPIAEY